jgi:DNA polymerase III delta prime subunit
MFDNLLYQDQAAQSLIDCFARKSLPRSLLFSGPFGSGKTTAAFELARAMSCSLSAEWNCPCPACERHRRMVHPDVMVMGPDRFGLEISAALEMMARSQSKRELYAFLRSIRRLTRRFDADLWAGEDSKFAKAAAIVLSIEELLSDLDPGSPKADPLQAAKRAAEEAVKLIPLCPQTIPIFQVRNAASWSHLSPSGKRKCLIVENADGMLDSSRNALLKLLEEPPENLSIIMTSSRKSAMIDTILSRLRDVPFRDRSAAEARDVLSRIFALSDPSFPSISAFLESYSDFPADVCRSSARAYLALAVERATSRGARLPAALGQAFGAAAEGLPQAALEREGFLAFLRCLLSELALPLRSASLDPDCLRIVDRWSTLVRDFALRAAGLNLNPESLSRSLLTEMDGAV